MTNFQLPPLKSFKDLIHPSFKIFLEYLYYSFYYRETKADNMEIKTN